MFKSTLQSDIDTVIRQLATGLSTSTGERFFSELVCFLGSHLHAKYAFAGRVTSIDQPTMIDTIAVAVNGTAAENFSYDLTHSPCARVVQKQPCVNVKGIRHDFPQNQFLQQMGAEGYVGAPLVDAKGRVIGILALLDDRPIENPDRALSILEIAAGRAAAELERISAEEQLKRSEERYALAMDASGVGSWEWNLQTNEVLWSSQMEPIFGFTPGDFNGTFDGFVACLHPDDKDRVLKAVQDALANNVLYAIEYRVVWPDGTLHWISARGKSIRDATGKPLRMIGVVWDSSAAKETEERLRRSETSLAEAQSIASLGSWEWNLESQALWWSDQLYRLYGYSPKSVEPTFERYLSHVHPDDKSIILAEVDRLTDSNYEPRGLIYRIVRINGDVRYVFDKARIVRDSSGTALRVIGAVQDVTDQNLTAAALKQSARQIATLYEAIPDMIFVHNQDGKVIDVNEQTCRAFGFEREEFLNVPFEQVCGEGYTWEMAKILIDQARKGQELDFEWVSRKKNGDEFPVEVRLRKISDTTTPEEPAVVAVVRDLTARKRVDEVISMLARSAAEVSIEQFVAECVQQLAKAYQARYAFVGQLVGPDNTKIQTRAVWAGDRLAENFVYDLNGTPCQDILNLKAEIIPRDAATRYPDDALLKTMGVESYYGAPLIASDGRMLGLVSVMDVRPMTFDTWVRPVLGVFATRLANEFERHEALQELKEYRDRLELKVVERTEDLQAVNRELESFAYSVSHDLRAPLRAVDGFSHALEEDYRTLLDQTAQRYIQRIRSGTRRMSNLIDAMLELSRISRREVTRVKVNVSHLAQTILEEQRAQLDCSTVSFKVQPGLTALVDPILMRVVLENLLGNAIKYSRNKARPEISLTTQENDGERVFCVADNGVGFNMSYSGKLFAAFQRLHRDTEFEGLGIGLATVQRVIHRHGGKIWAESEEGKGARFYFTLGEQKESALHSDVAPLAIVRTKPASSTSLPVR